MLACKILVGPISTDRQYETGETIVLDEKDATQLASYDLVEILGEVEPKFGLQTPPTPIVDASVAIVDIDEIEPVVEAPVVTEVAPPIVETGSIEPMTTEQVVVSEPVVEAPIVEAPIVVTPVDETTIVDAEGGASLEDTAATTKRKK
jgi:hypothetical protein